MNKLIVMNEDKIISGNNAIQPEYETYKPTVKKVKVKKNNRKKQTKHKIKVMRNIGIVFVIGVVLIARYSIIYNMQMQLNSTQNRVDKINKQNENLTVELVKYNNLGYIEDTAINKLHMIQPQKSSAVYADLNKTIIKEDPSKDKKKINSILDKVKQFKWR
ncbi:hypothetical protein [Clostridium tyrobutyricum]|uniref:hypothetical protein n=2 Tax=Clostridium tyrobutyricum TaxID=1519 RepID=UPI001FA71410|nr:hypothetical protein [Clostridium tyrobutyricum]MEA5008388.1 hypothetical protein [Clostridium tyrobutyricum]